MEYYDKKLQELGQQIARKRQLTAMLSQLKQHRSVLEASVAQLEKSKIAEQADVDRLEHRSLTALFYTIAGKKSEQIDKERAEAYAARVKYEAAASELADVKATVASYEEELFHIQNSERAYQRALEEKTEAIKSLGNPSAVEILEIEKQIDYITNQKREVQEAVTAGQRALATTDSVLESLNSAHNWGTFDLLGGGLISDMAKHSHLDEAQNKIECLQEQLRRFRSELSDVTIYADMQVNIDGFLRFADFFFDGLFADWAVQGKINNSISNVQGTKNQIEQILQRLNGINRSLEQNQKAKKEKLEELVKAAHI